MPWDSPEKPRDEDLNQRRRTRRRWVRALLDRRKRTPGGRRVSVPWKPDWIVKPEPAGDDEEFAKALYDAYVGSTGIPWDELDEWKRESWRLEYRDT